MSETTAYRTRIITHTENVPVNLPAYFKRANNSPEYYGFHGEGRGLHILNPGSEFGFVATCKLEDMPDNVVPVKAADFLAALSVALQPFNNMEDMIARSIPTLMAIGSSVQPV